MSLRSHVQSTTRDAEYNALGIISAMIIGLFFFIAVMLYAVVSPAEKIPQNKNVHTAEKTVSGS